MPVNIFLDFFNQSLGQNFQSVNIAHCALLKIIL